MAGISNKLPCLVKSNLCAKLKFDESHRIFLVISGVLIFVKRKKIPAANIVVVKELLMLNMLQIYCKKAA